MDFAAIDYLQCSNNTLIANTGVATSLTALMRTRAGQHMTITENTGDGGGLPFHNYVSTFGAEPSADGLIVRNNNFDGGGDYRSGSSFPFLTEESIYKVETDGAATQIFTLTHVSGPTLPLTAVSSGANLSLNIGWTSAASFYQVEVFGYAEVGANAEPYDETVVYTVDISGASRIIDVYTAPLGAALTYVQYNYANAGTQGTIFVRLKY
jgi:hypothetical protein